MGTVVGGHSLNILPHGTIHVADLCVLVIILAQGRNHTGVLKGGCDPSQQENLGGSPGTGGTGLDLGG